MYIKDIKEGGRNHDKFAMPSAVRRRIFCDETLAGNAAFMQAALQAFNPTLIDVESPITKIEKELIDAYSHAKSNVKEMNELAKRLAKASGSIDDLLLAKKEDVTEEALSNLIQLKECFRNLSEQNYRSNMDDKNLNNAFVLNYYEALPLDEQLPKPEAEAPLDVHFHDPEAEASLDEQKMVPQATLPGCFLLCNAKYALEPFVRQYLLKIYYDVYPESNPGRVENIEMEERREWYGFHKRMIQDNNGGNYPKSIAKIRERLGESNNPLIGIQANYRDSCLNYKLKSAADLQNKSNGYSKEMDYLMKQFHSVDAEFDIIKSLCKKLKEALGKKTVKKEQFGFDKENVLLKDLLEQRFLNKCAQLYNALRVMIFLEICEELTENYIIYDGGPASLLYLATGENPWADYHSNNLNADEENMVPIYKRVGEEEVVVVAKIGKNDTDLFNKLYLEIFQTVEGTMDTPTVLHEAWKSCTALAKIHKDKDLEQWLGEKQEGALSDKIFEKRFYKMTELVLYQMLVDLDELNEDDFAGDSTTNPLEELLFGESLEFIKEQIPDTVDAIIDQYQDFYNEILQGGFFTGDESIEEEDIEKEYYPDPCFEGRLLRLYQFIFGDDIVKRGFFGMFNYSATNAFYGAATMQIRAATMQIRAAFGERLALITQAVTTNMFKINSSSGDFEQPQFEGNLNSIRDIDNITQSFTSMVNPVEVIDVEKLDIQLLSPKKQLLKSLADAEMFAGINDEASGAEIWRVICTTMVQGQGVPAEGDKDMSDSIGSVGDVSGGENGAKGDEEMDDSIGSAGDRSGGESVAEGNGEQSGIFLSEYGSEMALVDIEDSLTTVMAPCTNLADILNVARNAYEKLESTLHSTLTGRYVTEIKTWEKYFPEKLGEDSREVSMRMFIEIINTLADAFVADTIEQARDDLMGERALGGEGDDDLQFKNLFSRGENDWLTQWADLSNEDKMEPDFLSDNLIMNQDIVANILAKTYCIFGGKEYFHPACYEIIGAFSTDDRPLNPDEYGFLSFLNKNLNNNPEDTFARRLARNTSADSLYNDLFMAEEPIPLGLWNGIKGFCEFLYYQVFKHGDDDEPGIDRRKLTATELEGVLQELLPIEFGEIHKQHGILDSILNALKKHKPNGEGIPFLDLYNTLRRLLGNYSLTGALYGASAMQSAVFLNGNTNNSDALHPFQDPIKMGDWQQLLSECRPSEYVVQTQILNLILESSDLKTTRLRPGFDATSLLKLKEITASALLGYYMFKRKSLPLNNEGNTRKRIDSDSSDTDSDAGDSDDEGDATPAQGHNKRQFSDDTNPQSGKRQKQQEEGFKSGVKNSILADADVEQTMYTFTSEEKRPGKLVASTAILPAIDAGTNKCKFQTEFTNKTTRIFYANGKTLIDLCFDAINPVTDDAMKFFYIWPIIRDYHINEILASFRNEPGKFPIEVANRKWKSFLIGLEGLRLSKAEKVEQKGPAKTFYTDKLSDEERQNFESFIAMVERIIRAGDTVDPADLASMLYGVYQESTKGNGEAYIKSLFEDIIAKFTEKGPPYYNSLYVLWGCTGKIVPRAL